ncbi:MAG TPA: phosphatidate cytidylyltransferase [Ignavibacteria bacterium]|nr:phosphatidate cytidylyltransferase [Ignavibacteria bacterium]HMR39977.1 phosphatidate cytidylyltransferase [Ignavibacteria bacterium]
MSNLTKRIIAGVFGIPLILGACYFGGIYFLIFSIIVSSLALKELFNMFEVKDIKVLKYTAIFISSLILVSGYFNFDITLIFTLTFFLIFTTEIFRKEKNPLNPVLTVFGLLYITLPFVLLNILLEENFKGIDLNIVIYLFILIWVCDTSAYFGGRFLGKHKLSEISPKKTREGSVTGLLMTMIVSVSIHYVFPEKLNLNNAVFIGLITGIFSQTGDLFESMLKRYCGVKDSSDLIPGHGGMLDRFDSIIFAAPVIFVYLNFCN